MSKKKQRLLYNRRNTLSGDLELIEILKKDPKNMSEEEKIKWKIEIFRQCEDTEDYLK